MSSALPGLPATEVVVAVLTWQRGALLAAMLPEVIAQAASLDPPAAVVVVDNDPAGTARAVVAAAARAATGVTVRHVVEPTPGIVAGRNRALDEAADAAALVFVDDDERVEPGWLAALVGCWRTCAAAAVAGPALWRVDAGTRVDPWVVASGFHDRERRPTGTRVPSAATHNLLLDLTALRRYHLRFDTRFALSGGEDTMLSRSLVAAGGVIVWCDEAVTVEALAPERATRRFVLGRLYRRANSWSRIVLLVDPPRRRWIRRPELVVRAGVRAGRAVIRWLPAVPRRDLPARARAECEFVAAIGMVSGVLGRSEQEYRRPV